MNRILHARSKSAPTKGWRRLKIWAALGLLLLLAPNAKAALSGTYTICPSGCNYISFAAAITGMTGGGGVSGPVTFNVYGGNYYENITIPAITGASATNTITFNGNGSQAGSTGTNGTGTTRLAANTSTYVVYMSSCKYVTFQNMIIEQTISSGSYTVYNYYSQYCTFNNCLVRYPIASTSYYAIYDYYTFHATYTNNVVRGGYYALYVYGISSATTTYGYNLWKNNKITQQYYYAMYSYYQNQMTFDGNYYDSAYSTSGYGIVELYGMGCTIKNNRNGGYNQIYGMLLEYMNYYNTAYPYTAYNNMLTVGLTSTPSYGLYLYYYVANCNAHIYHNSVWMSGGTYLLYCYNSVSGSAGECTNNAFYSTGSPYAYIYNVASTEKINGNNYYNAGGTLVSYNGTAYSDLASYKVAAAKNGHGAADANVKMPYKSSTDLHVDQNQGAPAGPYVGLAIDYDGDARCTLFPTVGADESNYGKSKPVAKIGGNATVYAGTPSTFYNSAKASEPKVHAWYLDAISPSTKLSDSIHLVTTALTVGTHTIYLVTKGCGGNDTAKFSVTVVNPTKKPVTDFISDKNVIRPGDVVRFSDLSTNGPSKWAWKISPDTGFDINGFKVPNFKMLYATSYSTPGMIVQFNQAGKYKVCLTTSNVIGAGTTVCKTAYIEVQASVNIGTVATVTNSSGLLYDNGGPNGNYTSTTSPLSITINPCSDSIYMVINYFNTYCGYDMMRIYDGSSNKGKVLHVPCTSKIGYAEGFTGGPVYTSCYIGSYPGCQPNTVQNYKPGGTIDTFLAKSGKMYIEFEAHNGSGPGYEAYWWSKPRTQPKPTAKFTCPDTVCTNGVVSFTNTTTGNDLTYLWDLDGDGVSDYTGKNPSWPYFFSGKATITLIANNCGGSDTFKKTITVLDPPAPKPTFTADNNNPTTNDIVFLSTKNIKACVDAYSWTITKKYAYKTGVTPTVVYVNGTSKGTANPAINLPDTGCWDVTLSVTNVSGTNSTFSGCFFNVKGSYCIPTVSTVIPDIAISRVVFNTINNSSSTGSTDYSNYASTISTNVELGVKYNLTVERTTNKNNVNRSLFIDWNGDGDFNDANENYANDSNSSALVWNTTVTIPTYATKGATVMRIAINNVNYSNKPCGQNEFGEYEDYRLYITADQTPPVIKIKTKGGKLADADVVYVEQGLYYAELGAQAIDNLDGDISSKVVTTQSPKFNHLIPGTYKFIYTAKDAAGNAAIAKTRTVIVTPDKSAPTLYVALPETTIVEVGNSVTIPKVLVAEDSLDGDVSATVVVNNPVVPSVVGMYTVTYSDSDAAGNKVVVYRYINIIDSIAPKITLNGKDTIHLEVFTPYTEQGIGAIDNYNNVADLLKNLIKAGNVDVNKLGTYTLTYLTTDGSGNKSNTLRRVVIVEDKTRPVVTANDNLKIDWDVFAHFNDPGANVTDNYYNNLSYTRLGTFYANFANGTPTKLGTYNIIYKATDGSGNTDSVVRIVNVLDRTAPVITLKGDFSSSLCRWASYTDAGYDLSDNYWANTDITVTKEGTFSTFNTSLAGLYNFRYKAVDKSNNVAYSLPRFVLVQQPTDAECSAGIKQIDLNKQISVFPNPTSGKFIIKANMTTSEKVRISVSNMFGQEIAVVNNGILNNNQFEVDLSSQSAGMYTVSIVMNNTVITKQIVVTR